MIGKIGNRCLGNYEKRINNYGQIPEMIRIRKRTLFLFLRMLCTKPEKNGRLRCGSLPLK
jgi:hypothetical protein